MGTSQNRPLMTTTGNTTTCAPPPPPPPLPLLPPSPHKPARPTMHPAQYCTYIHYMVVDFIVAVLLVDAYIHACMSSLSLAQRCARDLADHARHHVTCLARCRAPTWAALAVVDCSVCEWQWLQSGSVKETATASWTADRCRCCYGRFAMPLATLLRRSTGRGNERRSRRKKLTGRGQDGAPDECLVLLMK